MHTILKHASPFGTGFFRGQVVAPVARGIEILLLWQRRANERHALAQLDDRILRDLGLSRSEVARELRKPFWRA
jgi:uncharacterized protein YjiS (DUF1127 family)